MQKSPPAPTAQGAISQTSTPKQTIIENEKIQEADAETTLVDTIRDKIEFMLGNNNFRRDIVLQQLATNDPTVSEYHG